ncbi:MAG: SHD1 domain-containing protein [Pirellula sp.]|nr:SHD1 domain-containing protein [Pirellula sp.]
MSGRIRSSCLRYFCVAAIVVCCSSLPNTGFAQTRLEEGESVKVMFLNSWFDGTVLGKDKNRYGVEFEFAGTMKREMFERAAIRKACEIDALDLARAWESSNGKFKIDAALKSFAGDKVLLAKTDGNEIEVPITSLSEKDQLYLKKFKKQFDDATKKGAVPAAVPKLPPIEDFGSPALGDIGSMIGTGSPSSLGSVPNFYTTFEQSGTGFYFARDRQQIVAAIPVGGPDQLVLMTARENNFQNRGVEFQSQAYWVSLKQKKMLGSVALTPEDFIVDYDPRTKRLVSIHSDEMRGQGDQDTMTLWSLKPGDTQAEPLMRWAISVDVFDRSHFAKLITADLVLTKAARHTYVAWDTASKSIAYTFKSASFFDAPIVLTADRKSIIVPEDGKVSVIDALSGDLRFSLPVQDRHVSGANVNASGTKLAALTERHVYVWDLESRSTDPQVYEAPLIGSPFASRIEWVSDDLLLAESSMERVLYRLSLQLPVWSYRMEGAQSWLNRDPLTNQVLNGLFFYVAEPDSMRGSIAVGAVKLPGPQVDEMTSKLNRQSLMLMKQGVRIGLKLDKVSDPGSVQQWLSEKIQANRWVLDPNASIQLHAEMGVGKTQTETYREMGIGNKTTSVTFTPHFASIVIKQGDTIVWQTGTTTGPPPIVSGQNIQSEVAKSEVPQLDFFRVVKIPSEIIDPKYSRGFGVSKLGLRGVEVVSTTPPGRSGDPQEEDRKSDQERRDSNTNRP